jgi:hypothetical protein
MTPNLKMGKCSNCKSENVVVLSMETNEGKKDVCPDCAKLANTGNKEGLPMATGYNIQKMR